MSTIELKSMINEGLSNIDDITFLQSIYNLIESRFDETMYYLNSDQALRVEETKIDFITGLTLKNETLIEDIENWLNSK
ncbi:hypothetical protein MASR1M45_19370 [Candidatus Kapaibacterium sp.]